MTRHTHAPFPATSTGRVVSAVPVGRLVPYEEHDERRALRLARHVERVGVWTAPLVIERDSLVVMDGHHRLRAAQALQLSVLPVVLLSYEEGGVLLQAWRKGEVWSPAAVLSRARSGSLLPYKTTRHLFQPAIGSVGVPLGWLATRCDPKQTGPASSSPGESLQPVSNHAKEPSRLGLPPLIR